jgi:hypothetical protein
MEKATITMVNSYQYKPATGELVGDEYMNAVAWGYDAETALYESLEDIRRSCCEDFYRPDTCKPGFACDSYSVEAYIISEDEGEDDAEDIAARVFPEGWGITMRLDGKLLLLPPNPMEYGQNHHSLTSDKLKELADWPKSWEDLK